MTGKVEYGGSKVWEGQLTLVGADHSISVVNLTEDGTFKVSHPPLGRVKVGLTNYPVITSAAIAKQDSSSLPGQAQCDVAPRVSVQLPARLANPETSGIEVQIEPGEQRVNVTIARRDDDPEPVVRPALVIGHRVGDHVPEISGEDLQGIEMRLSQFRGKVVLLLFWAHWCTLCQDRLGEYRELVEQFEGEPFVLLGVNCDPERYKIGPDSEKAGVNWRSWWDGVAVGGPVSTAWGAEGLPCTVVIDPDGMIRYRNLSRQSLEVAISHLLHSRHKVTSGEDIH